MKAIDYKKAQRMLAQNRIIHDILIGMTALTWILFCYINSRIVGIYAVVPLAILIILFSFVFILKKRIDTTNEDTKEDWFRFYYPELWTKIKNIMLSVSITSCSIELTKCPTSFVIKGIKNDHRLFLDQDLVAMKEEGRLTEEEFLGVVWHEIAHIKNKDILSGLIQLLLAGSLQWYWLLILILFAVKLTVWLLVGSLQYSPGPLEISLLLSSVFVYIMYFILKKTEKARDTSADIYAAQKLDAPQPIISILLRKKIQPSEKEARTKLIS